MSKDGPNQNIDLRIEQLALEAISVPQSQRPQLQEALAKELSQLVLTHGIPASLLRGRLPLLRIDFAVTQPSRNLEDLGRKLAKSIYQKLQDKNVPSRERLTE